jgi:hypothetical protein
VARDEDATQLDCTSPPHLTVRYPRPSTACTCRSATRTLYRWKLNHVLPQAFALQHPLVSPRGGAGVNMPPNLSIVHFNSRAPITETPTAQLHISSAAPFNIWNTIRQLRSQELCWESLIAHQTVTVPRQRIRWLKMSQSDGNQKHQRRKCIRNITSKGAKLS